MTFILHNLQLSSTLLALGSNLGYWVKLCNTTWFFMFLLTEYDDQWWVQNFKMLKEMLFDFINKLRPSIMNFFLKYWFVIWVEVRVACVIHKLSHGSNLLTCSKLFSIGKSIVRFVNCEIVKTKNNMFKTFIAWLVGQKMEDVMSEFKESRGIPSVHGVINNTHITISKPKVVFVEDYYFHKNRRYSIVAWVVVDVRFIDIFVGLFGSVNDFRVRKSGCKGKHSAMDCSPWRGEVNKAIVLTFLVTKYTCCYLG